jgi:hypothetical protein
MVTPESVANMVGEVTEVAVIETGLLAMLEGAV